MRKVLLIASLSLLAVAFAMATTSYTTGSPTSTATSANAKPETVQGCLFAADGIYTLPDSSGGIWQLLGSPNEFKDEVGHTVALTGTGNNAAVLTGNPKKYIDVDMASVNDFQVSSVKQIAATCSVQSARADRIGVQFEKENS